MSERFTLDVRMDMPKLLIDKNTNEKYNLLMVNDIERIVDLLNEQQATIEMYQRRVDSLKKTDFDFTIKQGELITKFSLGEDKILFETTQDYETIQTLSKWLYSMYDEIQKLKKELKWKREEIKALIEESERDE